MDMEVEKVALCPGAGGSVIEEAIHAGAKALVTGDISHHQGIDAAARNMAVIDAGHYGMEHIFIQYMAGYLKENLPVEMEIVTVPSAWPTVLL
jgi:putative NIF3 family GTP cyclohydrolase 1 type 2